MEAKQGNENPNLRDLPSETVGSSHSRALRSDEDQQLLLLLLILLLLLLLLWLLVYVLRVLGAFRWVAEAFCEGSTGLRKVYII